MVTYIYRPQAAIDAGGELVTEGSGQVFAAPIGGSPLTVRNSAGVNVTTIGVSGIGQTELFEIDDYPELYWRSGGYVVHIFSITSMLDAATAAAGAAQTAAAAAQAARDAVALSVLPEGGGAGTVLMKRSLTNGDWYWATPPSGGGNGSSVTWDTLPGKPTDGFPPSAHTHNPGDISTSTPIGRSLLTAVDAQTARQAIGAGTGNGTSNLTIGTTSTTAAAGNHSHKASAIDFTPPSGSPITATNVQDAIVQAAATGGGSGGSSSILVWTYRSGGYPALPTTEPTGGTLAIALGPVQPGSMPSWIGGSASQVPFIYLYSATS